MDRPLILVTNDDGIGSAGLQAAVNALTTLGDIVVAAPNRQWSGAGRSMPRTVSQEVVQVTYPVSSGQVLSAYAIDASPALCVIYAMLQLVPRLPDLVVSGINFGENVSTEITISGTVGAALEAASFDVPALAISVEMPVDSHLTGSATQSYAGAQSYARRFSERMVGRELPFDVDVISINLPAMATPETPWRLTRLSRHRYFVPTSPEEARLNGGAGYRVMDNPEQTEVGSDTWCLHYANEVSVTPLSLDFTSRVDFGSLDEHLRRESLI